VRSGRRAVIDIGTNSVKVLIADVAGNIVTPVHEESRQTRLGRDFFSDHTLKPGAIDATARAVADFANLARGQGAAELRLIATSAAREATNTHELLTAVERVAGLRVEVIPGDLEAELAFQGVTTDPRHHARPILLVDTGGGSSEFVLGEGKTIKDKGSFPLGTVRLLEQTSPGEPPAAGDLQRCRDFAGRIFQEKISPWMVPLLQECRKLSGGTKPVLLATGGTASILGRMETGLSYFDREALDKAILTRERLTWHVEHLWKLDLASRKRVVGLPPDRADVILTGSVIFEAIMRELDFADLRITTRGLRFAALLPVAGFGGGGESLG
jgi:exopolyphosphatase/guanosine-5'-triphosphate,3'-diphosphate pyrophosphatase